MDKLALTNLNGMNKYIPAEKLIAKLIKMQFDLNAAYRHPQSDNIIRAISLEYDDVISLITSLQQEQPESTCKTCGFYENNCPFIRGKLIPYPNRVCKDYTWSSMKEQEQPEMEKYDCPTIPIEQSIEVISRMQYIDEELKPIAKFIMDYASWNLHKDEWNQPTIEVPLFRVLDALVQKGKPYCCAG